MEYTYVLRSKIDNNLYIGYTPNLRIRDIKHNKGLVKATATRRPLELVYYEACLTKKKRLKEKNILKQDSVEDI